MKKYLLLFITLLVGLSFIFSARTFAVAFNPFQDVCSSNSSATVCREKQNPQCADRNQCPNSIYGPGSILAKATSVVALVTGVAAVLLIIIGGIQFALSGGDSNNVNHARSTVLYALIGAAIAVVAESIVVFVINRL